MRILEISLCTLQGFTGIRPARCYIGWDRARHTVACRPDASGRRNYSLRVPPALPKNGRAPRRASDLGFTGIRPARCYIGWDRARHTVACRPDASGRRNYSLRVPPALSNGGDGMLNVVAYNLDEIVIHRTYLVYFAGAGVAETRVAHVDIGVRECGLDCCQRQRFERPVLRVCRAVAEVFTACVVDDFGFHFGVLVSKVKPGPPARCHKGIIG